MKKRYIYLILFAVPGLLVSGIIVAGIVGTMFGFFWLFVFGDGSWPDWDWVSAAASALFIAIFLVSYAIILIMGYGFGKRMESGEAVSKKHILISIGVTIAIIAFILLRSGSIGPKSLEEKCSDSCSERGFNGSSMPPKDSGDTTCSCYDNTVNKWIEI